MLTSTERAVLAAEAQKLKPVFQIGKNGIDASVIKAVDEALTAREIVKVTVLKNAGMGTKEALNALAAALNAEPIAALGFKAVLYRYSDKASKARAEKEANIKKAAKAKVAKERAKRAEVEKPPRVVGENPRRVTAEGARRAAVEDKPRTSTTPRPAPAKPARTTAAKAPSSRPARTAAAAKRPAASTRRAPKK